jgi:hypothetical protein
MEALGLDLSLTVDEGGCYFLPSTSSYCQWSPEMPTPEPLRFQLLSEVHLFLATQSLIDLQVVEPLQKPVLWSFSWRQTEDQHCVGTNWILVAQ